MEQVTIKSPNDIATELKKEAQKNKAFEDVCTVFATRERTRAQVTVNSLKATMAKAGFNHEVDEYKDVIARLARLGVGKLHKDTKGRVRALTDVKYTLQSIGLSAVGEKLNLSPFNKAKRFAKLNHVADTVAEIRASAPTNILPKQEPKTIVKSTINGKEFAIPLTNEEFTAFLADLLTSKLK